jgi:hypothetical protein
MKAFYRSRAGFLRDLAALLPVAAQAGPVPTITVVVLPGPLHRRVQGWHFTPSGSVEVHAEYFPMTKGTVKTITANTSGAIAVNLPVVPLRRGVETIDVSASYKAIFAQRTEKVKAGNCHAPDRAKQQFLRRCLATEHAIPADAAQCTAWPPGSGRPPTQ